MQTLPDDCRPDIDNLMEWLGQANYVEEETKAQFSAARELAKTFHDNGIRTFVMKGFSIGRLYPKPEHRSGCDLDCFLINDDADATEKGNRIVEGLGVKVDRSYYKNSKFTFNALTVENHRHVLPVKGSRKAKELERWLLERIVPEKPIFIEESYLESPSELFLVVHTLAHAQEHFLNEGISLRHVCDWAVILRNTSTSSVQAENENFWNIWKKTCEEFGLLKFGLAMSRLANRICGVEIPFECPLDDDADNRLLNDILRAKHSDTKNDNARRVELIRNIFRDSWKFKYFSDTNAFAFALSRIWGYLFEKG